MRVAIAMREAQPWRDPSGWVVELSRFLLDFFVYVSGWCYEAARAMQVIVPSPPRNTVVRDKDDRRCAQSARPACG
jgi:hypothetical protein